MMQTLPHRRRNIAAVHGERRLSAIVAAFGILYLLALWHWLKIESIWRGEETDPTKALEFIKTLKNMLSAPLASFGTQTRQECYR